MSPLITVATLRTNLVLDIPKDCKFIYASKMIPINVEMEDIICISKISDDNNYIYIESEQKKEIEYKNRPIEISKKVRKEGILDIYLFPSCKFIIGNQNNSEKDKEKTRCLGVTEEIGRKIILFIGEIGSGKTTLINGFLNTLCGIQFEDDFRYIIDEQENYSLEEDDFPQNKRRTSYITIYNIDSINNNPPMTFIDTPGFDNNQKSKFNAR